jgi:osmoprotectant transport system permease protein
MGTKAQARMSVFEQVWAWLTDPENWTGDEGIPTLTWQHVRITVLALLLAMLLTMPLAVWLGHLRRGGSIATSIGNVGRAIPTLGVLVMFAVSPVGVSELAVILALVVFAVPPLLTNTYIAVRDVDDELRDAARGMGMTPVQMVMRVELPMAMPVIAAGLRTTVVQVVATATLAAFIGAGTLGLPVVVGFGLQDDGQLFGGALLVALLCLLAEGAMALLERALTPDALRLTTRERAGTRPSVAELEVGSERVDLAAR